MIDKNEIMPFNFFKYGGVYSGEHGGMRYKIFRDGDKPDFKLFASVWQGPFAYDAVSMACRTECEFTYDEEGREKAIDWLLLQYDERKAEWDAAPSILDAVIDINAIYSQT